MTRSMSCNGITVQSYISDKIDGEWVDHEITVGEEAEYKRKEDAIRKVLEDTQTKQNQGLTPCSPYGEKCDTPGSWKEMQVFDFEHTYGPFTHTYYVGALTTCRKCGFVWRYDANI